MAEFTGLIVDYGGVFTSSQSDCFERFCAAEDLDFGEFTAVVNAWLEPGEDGRASPAHALERGELPISEFERALASRLRRRDGRRPEAAGLVGRLLGGVRHHTPVAGVVRRARAGGVRTALLSNAWSRAGYDMTGWDELFDAVVVSSEVGMRKPEARIYRHAARLLAVPPERCVFVDDSPANVRGAEAVGMRGIHHTAAGPTRAELRRLLGLPV